ncbi:MAG: hypothetical protein KDC38_21030, partial [Planctomycetes bacterium]|nr:hypothetical protein [Planctomycetota bacterium]
MRTLAFACVVALAPTFAWADGSEMLGNPTIPIANGNIVMAAGTGMQNGPGLIQIDLPAADIVQVIAYWSGAELGPMLGDDSIQIAGVDVFGKSIGGPTFFFTCPAGCGPTAGDFYYSAFRADVTDLGLLAPGSNTLEVTGVDFFAERSGVGLLVILDDGTGPGVVRVRDGLDLAFLPFRAPLDTTVPQTFTFAPAPFDRTGQLTIFAGSVGDDARTSAIDVVVGSTTTTFDNPLGSNDGPLWDTTVLSFPIAAGATEVVAQ